MSEPLLAAALARRNTGGARRCGSCARPGAITDTTRRCGRGTNSSSCASGRSWPAKSRWVRSTTSASTRRSCSRTCCSRSRPWAWDCATSRARSSDWLLRSRADLARLRTGPAALAQLEFQAEAMRLVRARLGAERALIGFVGGPFTLYAYAVAGSHEGFARDGPAGARGWPLCRLLRAPRGAAGRQHGAAGAARAPTAWRCSTRPRAALDAGQFARHAAPALGAGGGTLPRVLPAHAADLLFPRHRPRTLARARRTRPAVPRRRLAPRPRGDARDRSRRAGACRATSIRSGCCCRRPSSSRACERCSRACAALPAAARAAWVCGLGHGVLPGTPEENVRLVLDVQREMFP